jgi:hypothetical protein
LVELESFLVFESEDPEEEESESDFDEELSEEEPSDEAGAAPDFFLP